MTEENSSMDYLLGCLNCLWNKRTSDSFNKTSSQGCTDCLQSLHPIANPCVSCHRNFKCRPWRRKSILNSAATNWSWINLLPWTTLFLLLTNIVQGGGVPLKKCLRLNPVWGLFFVTLFGGISLPMASCQANLQPTQSFKSQQLPNAVIHVGSAFTYNISDSAFDCEVDSIVVSETADRFLSHWLAYSSSKKQLYGVPTDKDEGLYNILVVALTKDARDSGHICGSRSFFIKVVPVSEEFPVSIYPGAGTSSKESTSAQSLPCVPGTQVVQATVVLNADIHGLNGHERMALVLKIADHLNLHTRTVSLFPGQASHPIIGQLDNPTVMVAGAGDGRFAKGSKSLLTWLAGCGAIKLEDLALSKLETDSQDGTISSLLGVPVVGWHVMSGAQKKLARHRIRRQVIGVTATPTTQSVPPSRMSNISTSVIVSRTVTVTSAFSRSSVIQLSTSVLSSVAANRTYVSSLSIPTIITRILSQPLSRTDVLSSSINNITSSNIRISPSSMRFTETVIVNSSEIVFSRNVTTSIKSSALFSSLKRTTLLMSSSVFSSTVNSTFITRTATSSVSSSAMSSLSLTTSRARNSSSIAVPPNETAATVSSLLTVTSVNSTRLTPSSVFTTNFSSQTLVPFASQVNSSAVPGTSLLAVSSSTPTPVVSHSSVAVSPYETTATVSSLLTVPSVNSTRLIPSSVFATNFSSQTMVPFASQVNSSAVAGTSLLAVSSSTPTPIVSHSSFLSSASLNLTITLQPTSGPKSSTSLLNVATSTPLLRTLTMSTKLSPILSTSSSFALEANSSVLITSSVNQTVASTRSHASNSSTIVSSFVAMSSFSSLETPPNTTTVIVGNASSSLFVSTHLRSSPVMSTPQQNSTTVQNRTSATLMLTPSLSLVPTVRSIISSFDTTVQTVSSAVTNSSSLVTPSFSGSVAMLSSSVLLPTSSVFSSSSIVKVNVSTVVTNFTSPSLQPNVTSTAVVLSSFTASPVVTSLNFTSMLISVNASTTRRTPLLNSTSKFDRSSFATITSSEFSPTGTIGSRTFPTTFADNRTVIPSSSTGVDIATVNVTVTRIISTNSASLSTLVVTSFLLSSTFKLDLTSTKTSSSLPGSSIVDVNSSVISRTLSSAVTRLVNSSVSSPRTSLPFFTTVSATQAAEVNSTTFIPTSSQMLPNSSLLSLVISSSSKPVFASSTILLPDTSSVLKATETSVSFTLVGSSVLNTSATVLSMFVSSPKIVSTEIRTAIGSSLARNSSAFDASLVTSPLTSRTLTIASRSNTILLSESLQNTTTVLRTSGLVSPSMTASVLSSSSVILSSGFGTNSTTTRIPSSATVTPTFTTGLPISVTVTPSSLGVQTTPAVRSFTQGTSVKSFITPVFTRSTLQTDVATPGSTRTVALTTQVLFSSSAVISVSSRTPSLVPPSATFTPVNRTTASGVATSGMLSSSSIDLPSSNTTQIVTPTDSAVTLSVTPSSTVIIPTTAPSNSPPRLYNNMGRISAPAGKALYFTIPDDTFYDSEDKATTRNLALSVLLADGSSIPSDFWLQFDATSQTIYGLPLSEHVPSGVIGEGFILRAQDSQGAQALDAFEVLVVPSEEPVVQELRIRIANDFSVFNRNVSQRLLLLEKIATYYGDRDTSSIRVLTFFAGSVIMTWTNDSLPTDRCDDEKVDYVANKVLLPDGEVSLDFKVALQGFPVESASENRQGVCNGSEPVPGTPIGPAQQSRLEEDMWYKHVLVGVLIALIILVLAALLIWYCRRKRPKPSNEKRTYKKRKPIILEPDIELKPIPGKPLVLPDDDPSIPPSYISETSLDKPLSSDDEDEWDYGRRSPSVVYEPPPPFYPTLANDHRNSPPPVYLMPPMY